MKPSARCIAPSLYLIAVLLTLGGCATGQDLRETSRKMEDQTETVRTSLESKIEQLKKTQREAEKTLAKLEQLIEDNKREQSQTRELAAKLNSDLRGFREMDLTKLEGRLERAKRDTESLQGKVEDQVSGLQQNAQQWLATLDQKQTAKLDQQVTRVDQQLAKVDQQLGKVEGRLETIDKREAAATSRIQDMLKTLGAKIDDRLDSQDRRIEGRIKKVEDDGRTTTNTLAVRLTDLDKSLAQMSDTVKTIGGKLSTQLEQQGGSVARLDEVTKQADGQIRTLGPRVDQLKTSLADLTKVLHALTDRSAEIDRRTTGLAGQIEEKAGALTVQQAEQNAKMEKLGKRFDVEGQAVTGHLNIVTQNVNMLAKSVETLQGKVGEMQGRVGELTSRNPGETEARLEGLTKSLNSTMTTVNETTRAVGDLKQVLEVSVGKLASRVDEHGDALNKLAQQLQNPRTVSSVQGPVPDGLPNAGAAGKLATEQTVSPESVYEHAYQEFQQNQYENALASFRSFLSQYPDSILVPNAHFWIAECYVKKRDYPRSLTAYEEVIQNHPRSGKASIALYRKALVLLELNDKPAAKTVLKKLLADYPKSEESKQARTKLASLQ